MAAKVDQDKCSGCGKCAEICPVQAINIENEKAIISDDCIECGACLNACSKDALSI